ncbi:MAG: Hint domain-containing protein, partial [Albidovulum sp.]
MNDNTIDTTLGGNTFDCIVGRLSGNPAPAAGAPSRSSRRPRAEPIRWALPGLCSGVRVTTSFGDLPVEALRKRDPLRTQSGSLALVAWVDRILLDEDFLAANPDALPVRISAGAFGAGLPERDLILSPHQPVNVSPSVYGQEFRRARDLLDRPGVFRQPIM